MILLSGFKAFCNINNLSGIFDQFKTSLTNQKIFALKAMKQNEQTERIYYLSLVFT